MLKKFLFAFLLLALPYQMYACALCALYTPSATVSINLEGTPTKIETITFQWTFSQDFINTLLERYDENHNNKLDPKEIERIKVILENYISKRHYLTNIEYLSASRPNQEDIKKLPLKIISKSFWQEADTLNFRFTTLLNQEIATGDELSFVIEDKEEYFKFLVHTVTHTIAEPFSLEFNLFNHIAFTKITHGTTTQPQELSKEPTTTQPQELSKEPTTTLPQEQPKELPASMSWLQSRLTHMQQNIQETIRSLKEQGTPLTYALFLGLSFLYGLLHAAGPGHGKALVSSYLFASEHRYSKAISMAALIGIVHTFAAFLLTLVIYFLFDLFFNAFFDNVTYYATKLSALIIISIAGYLVWKKIKAMKAQPKIVAFSTHPFACQCAGCSQKSQSTDWGVVLSAGIIPCPGTITIFIFALNTGAYILGFLAALSMSFGMSSIIALTSIATLFTKKRFQTKSPKIILYSETISLAIMLILGILLLIA
ncbi:nickel/cobalt transporter [Sulfurospirillum sp.]|uniref:nickel/cobalt transporter n=1 Tax=Sulfurospirillum sp. TaxID=2053622 RepID=UPI002FDDD6DE